MKKFQIQIFRYSHESNPDLGMWHVTAWGDKCTTREETIALAKKMAEKHRMPFSRVRAVEILESFYGLPSDYSSEELEDKIEYVRSALAGEACDYGEVMKHLYTLVSQKSHYRAKQVLEEVAQFEGRINLSADSDFPSSRPVEEMMRSLVTGIMRNPTYDGGWQ